MSSGVYVYIVSAVSLPAKVMEPLGYTPKCDIDDDGNEVPRQHVTIYKGFHTIPESFADTYLKTGLAIGADVAQDAFDSGIRTITPVMAMEHAKRGIAIEETLQAEEDFQKAMGNIADDEDDADPFDVDGEDSE